MRRYLCNRARVAGLLNALNNNRFCITCSAFLANKFAELGQNEKAMHYDSNYDYYKKVHAHILDEIKKLRR